MNKKKLKELRDKILVKLFRFYPPYFGAGVKIKCPKDDFSVFEVSMPLTKLNQNYVGTHFGGSLYSMCDPFFMLILMKQLGEDYLCWDKSASIHFVSPGRGTVYARFEIPKERVQEIKEILEEEGKHEPEFQVNVVDENNRIVARVNKKLWIKKKV